VRHRHPAGPGVEQLRDSEVEKLRLPCRRDEDVPGFDVAVDDEVLVRGIHGAADIDEKAQARRDIEPMTVAIRRDRQTIDVLHDEIGQLSFNRATIEQLRDVRVTERSENLSFGNETPVELLGVGLLRRILIATSRLNSRRRARRGTLRPSRRDRARVRRDTGQCDDRAAPAQRAALSREEAAVREFRRAFVRGKQRIDFRAQLGIVRAAVVEPRVAPGGIEVERLLEYFLYLGAARGWQRAHSLASAFAEPRSANAR
jgi:hypothetical protein